MVDFGYTWNTLNGLIKWRVSYIPEMRELFMQSMTVDPKHSNRVVLAREVDRQTVDRIMEGWTDVINEPNSIELLRGRLEALGIRQTNSFEQVKEIEKAELDCDVSQPDDSAEKSDFVMNLSELEKHRILGPSPLNESYGKWLAENPQESGTMGQSDNPESEPAAKPKLVGEIVRLREEIQWAHHALQAMPHFPDFKADRVSLEREIADLEKQLFQCLQFANNPQMVLYTAKRLETGEVKDRLACDYFDYEGIEVLLEQDRINERFAAMKANAVNPREESPAVKAHREMVQQMGIALEDEESPIMARQKLPLHQISMKDTLEAHEFPGTWVYRKLFTDTEKSTYKVAYLHRPKALIAVGDSPDDNIVLGVLLSLEQASAIVFSKQGIGNLQALMDSCQKQGFAAKSVLPLETQESKIENLSIALKSIAQQAKWGLSGEGDPINMLARIADLCQREGF